MSRGYTIAEVMISLAVLGIGASGVVAMQKATQIANTSARNLVTANAIAQSWAERLRAEALQWNSAADRARQTRWLRNADADAPAWFNPQEAAVNTAGGPAGAPSADVLGADVFTGDTAQPAFCTKVRLTVLKIPDATRSRIIRAEIRVFWERAGAPVVCTANPEPGEEGSSRFGFVTLTTAVMQNVLP
jgi:prepilin-type N-terminal cleavage/methylation domain-containing protein